MQNSIETLQNVTFWTQNLRNLLKNQNLVAVEVSETCPGLLKTCPVAVQEDKSFLRKYVFVSNKNSIFCSEHPLFSPPEYISLSFKKQIHIFGKQVVHSTTSCLHSAADLRILPIVPGPVVPAYVYRT